MPLSKKQCEGLKEELRVIYADDPSRLAVELAVVDAMATKDWRKMMTANARAAEFRKGD